MSEANDDQLDRWKTKYYDSLETLETKEQDWARVRDVLYRAMARLALVAYGTAPVVDRRLDDLREALRARRDADRLTTLIETVHDAAARAESARTEDAPPDPLSLLRRVLDALPVKQERAARKLKRLRARLEDGGLAPDKAVEAVVALLGEWLCAGEGEAPGGGTGLLGRLLGRQSGSQPATEAPGNDRPAAVDFGLFLDALELPAALDARTRTLRRGLRDQATDEALATLAAELSRALSRSEPPAGDEPPQPSLDRVLTELLERLSLTAEFQEDVAALRERVDEHMDARTLGNVLDGVAGLVTDAHAHFQHERSELQRFLQDLTGRLQDLDRHLQGAGESRDESLREGRDLQANVAAEVRGIQSDVRQAADLQALTRVIEDRLETIAGHMQTFMAAEENRHESARSEIERLSGELKETQAESGRLREKLRSAHERAMRDGLTGIHNRLAFDDRLAQEHARWKRYGEPLSVQFWDIDRFKLLNDTYGHQAGDKVLKTVAQLFSSRIREVDFLARYGGEEFVILMPQTDREAALKVADKLRRAIEQAAFQYQGERVLITASCGIAEFTGQDTAEAVLGRADAALYEAKSGGRNQCRLEAA